MAEDSLKTFGEPLPGFSYVERPGAYAFLFNELNEIAVIQTGQGLFLPGGGLEPGEDPVSGLERELREEIGYVLRKAQLVTRAAQYHWSEFYRSHFKKIGWFFEAQATPPAQPCCAKDHELIWLPPVEAARVLSQEFQRWAVIERCLTPRGT